MLAPSGIVTMAGSWTSSPLLLVNRTLNPPGPAARLDDTRPCVARPAITGFGDTLNEVRVVPVSVSMPDTVVEPTVAAMVTVDGCD